MSKLYIPITKPTIGQKEIQAISKVLFSGKIAQGKIVELFEKKLAMLCKTRYALTTTNGTTALHLALLALNIPKGMEVITTPFTFVATANAILMSQLQPVFADIDSTSFNIDPQSVEKVITSKTRAIIAVNLFGQPANYKALKKVAQKYNLKIIEDAAQSINANYFKKKSGNLADIGCFSFYATKNITTGEGGLLTTNNSNYERAIYMLRNHGQTNKRYYYQRLGYNYRLTDLLASIGLTQLTQLDRFTEKRQQIAKYYTHELSNINGLITPQILKNRSHVFHQYTLRITDDSPITRNELNQILKRKGIATNIYYPQPLYRFNHLKTGKRLEQYLQTEKTVKECLSLPIYPSLSKDESRYIVNSIRSAYAAYED